MTTKGFTSQLRSTRMANRKEPLVPMMVSLLLAAVVTTTGIGPFGHGAEAFRTPRTLGLSTPRAGASRAPEHRGSATAAWSAIEPDPTAAGGVRYESVFDFSGPDRDAVVAKFDRIDDAIMGGISTSSLRASGGDDDDSEGYASWSGVCRLDGGGFCGTRTLPFQDGVPLKVVDDEAKRDGFYLTVRLASDNEPERRVWKLTTRVENVQTTELVYQTDFEIPPQTPNDGDDDGFGSQWKTIRVPFDRFVQVRGPRIVPDGPPLDVTGGLYQVGMTMSKFRIMANATELANFRPGYFELQIRDIGLYTNVAEVLPSGATAIDAPSTVTKEEALRKRPLLLRVLLPAAKLFFSENRNRRKSATRILKERWGLSRWGVTRFGFRRRAAGRGLAVALAQSLVESVAGTARLVAFWTLKIALFYPLVAIRRTLNLLKEARPTQPRPRPE
mmetsp:Transcript_6163/g.15241  ORF Transcript_6163/g.15241 Transcript_6163/m.15241 type:complete len:444 (-) Transcript_6163:161-1492(-)